MHYWRLQAQEIFFSTLKRLFGKYLYSQFSGQILLGNQVTYNFFAIRLLFHLKKLRVSWTIMNKNGSNGKKNMKKTFTNLQLQNEDSFHLQLGGNWKVSSFHVKVISKGGRTR